jgi:hypothetical protein
MAAGSLRASSCEAGEGVRLEGRALEFSIGPGIESSQRLGVGELQPTVHGLVGAETRIRYRAGGLVAGLSGAWGGGRTDVGGGAIAGGGRIESVLWRIGGTVGMRSPLGDRGALDLELEGWYGEDRSWVKDVPTPYDGPHAFLGGGAVRCEVSRRLMGRLSGYGAIAATVYRGRAVESGLVHHVGWLGSGLWLNTGITWVVLGTNGG